MTVEDAIELLAEKVYRGLYTVSNPDEWAYKFVLNVAQYTGTGKPLSTEQSRIILKLVRREHDWLVQRGTCPAELASLLRAPSYRQPPYPSANVPREVRFLGGHLLGFRFKRNDAIVQALRMTQGPEDLRLTEIWFHREHRLWVVPVTRESLDGIMKVISEHRFDFDDAVADFLMQCTNNRERPTAFMVDRDLGVVAGQVYNCEFTAWWTQHVLGGEPV